LRCDPGPLKRRPSLANDKGLAQLSLTINEREHQVAVDPRNTLLELLREHIGLTGTKKGCDHGQCGACTVLAGKQRVLSCLSLAAAVREPVTTIEGLSAADGSLHPMQAAFIQHDAFQCGYCTPGQILSAVACVRERHAETDTIDPRVYEWQHLPLCRLSPHRRRDQAGEDADGTGLSHAPLHLSARR
jgi:xanthine dehydrogenase YagT iron-sulfur-binding subunit